MISFNCPHCGKTLQVDDAYAGSSGVCPFCGQTAAIPSPDAAAPNTPAGAASQPPQAPPWSLAAEPAPRAKTSGWAVASLICGIFGCLFLPIVPAIICGILGIRQVNRGQGAVKGLGLAIAGLVLGAIFVLGAGVEVAVLLPALSSAMRTADRMKCAANMRSIGQAVRIYAMQNKGHWPTVYSYPAVAKESWSGFDPATGDIADRGAAGATLAEHGPFTCNASALWLLVRDKVASPNILICPDSGLDADATADASRWWSFQNINNVGYSYQNQLGRNTTDSADSSLIVAADRNPQREDVTDAPSGSESSEKCDWNSPNHKFTGQNCLYADGHVEWQNSAVCGIRGNNIWTKSTPDADGTTWTDDTASYADKSSTVGDKRDSFLVP